MFASYTTTWSEAGEVAGTAILLLAGIVLVVRIAGLRSFAKMSSTDFAITVAIGSILGGVATSSTVPLAHGLIAAATLLAAKAAVAIGRRHGLGRIVDNDPVLIMAGSSFLEANMAKAKVTRGDIAGKLREANVLRLEDVRAVVFESTGDMTVLHGDHPVDPVLLEDVVDGDRIVPG